MAPRRETTETERAQMKILRDEGYSFPHIADRMNLPPSTVNESVRRHGQNGNFNLEEATGKKVSSRLVRKTFKGAGLGGYVAVRKPKTCMGPNSQNMGACAMEKSYVH